MDLDLAAELMETCYLLYKHTPLGLAPEIAHFHDPDSSEGTSSTVVNEDSQLQALQASGAASCDAASCDAKVPVRCATRCMPCCVLTLHDTRASSVGIL